MDSDTNSRNVEWLPREFEPRSDRHLYPVSTTLTTNLQGPYIHDATKFRYRCSESKNYDRLYNTRYDSSIIHVTLEWIRQIALLLLFTLPASFSRSPLLNPSYFQLHLLASLSRSHACTNRTSLFFHHAWELENMY